MDGESATNPARSGDTGALKDPHLKDLKDLKASKATEALTDSRYLGDLQVGWPEDSLDSIMEARPGDELLATKSSTQLIIPSTKSLKKNGPEVDEKAESVTKFLRPHEILKLGPPDARVQILSHQFLVYPSRSKFLPEDGPNKSKVKGTLYRALAQAITNEEHDQGVVRQVIAKSIIGSWASYGRILVPAYEGKIKRFNPQEIPKKSEAVQRAYLKASLSRGIEGTVVELMVAAKKFGFTYTLILVEPNCLKVMNCHDEETKSGAKRKFFFLRTGHRFEDWNWQFLLPYGMDGIKIRIPSGTYPLNIINCFDFNRPEMPSRKREMASESSVGPSPPVPKEVTDYPSAFVLEDGRLYGWVATGKTDIFTNLSALLYQSPALSNEIFEAIRGLRKFPFRSIKKLLKTRVERLPMKFDVGTVQDLKVASEMFNFTYTMYGIDEEVNFLKVTEIPRGFKLVEVEGTMAEGDFATAPAPKHLTLLARMRKHFPLEWFVLVELQDATMTPRDPKLLVDNSEIEKMAVLQPPNPLRSPYTQKKEGLFGVKYRALRKEALAELKADLGYGKGRNKKDAQTGPDGSVLLGYSSEEDYFADFSDLSSLQGSTTHLEKKKKGNSFVKLLTKGPMKGFNFRKSQVAPEEEGPKSESELDIRITYYEEGN